MRPGDLAVLLALAALLALAVFLMLRRKRKGKGCCGGDCSACGLCTARRNKE